MVLILLQNNGTMFNVGLVETNKVTGSRKATAQMMDKDIPQPGIGASHTEPRGTNHLARLSEVYHHLVALDLVYVLFGIVL